MTSPDYARKSYLKQDKEYKSYLDAFTKGMNDYAKAHPEAIGKDFKQVLPVNRGRYNFTYYEGYKSGVSCIR